MPTMVQVMVHRELSPEEGQRHLEQMATEVKRGAATPGFGMLHIPGVTRRENPFPEWMQKALERNDLVYNEINLAYQASFPTIQKANAFRMFFDATFRPYVIAAPHQKTVPFDVDQLHIRVMEEDEMTDGKTSF